MKRLAFAALAATAVAACSNEQPVPSSPGTGAPSFAISDGSSGGNPHFFFLPPLVKQPTFSGTFNPNLLPSVEICHLTTDPTCQSFVQRFAGSDIQGGSSYQVNWNTSPSVIVSGDIYRVRVIIGGTATATISGCPAPAADSFPASGPGCRELGYLDTKPVATPQEVPGTQAPGLYVFLNGSNNPVKFRIEKSALCDPNAKDCGEGTASNGGGTISATYSNLVIPPGSISQTVGNVTIVVQKLACTADGRVSFIPADLPQFQGCYDFQTFPAGVTFDASYIVGMCLLRPTGLSHAQEDLMQIHKFEPTNPGAGVEALAEATATIDCTDFGTITTASANPILNLAHRLEIKVRGWLSPTMAFAAHLGGGTGSKSLSHMVWAIPSQMAKLAGDNQTTGVGTAVPIAPSVKVTDAGGSPVQGATVHFTPSAGSSITYSSTVPCLSNPDSTCVATDANGVAQVASWVVGPPSGTYTLTASGVGLGSSPTTSGVLTTGSVTFTATACSPGFGTATIDGVINANEWQCAKTQDFTANLSGGNAPATLYYMNDGTNLYLAVKVTRNVTDKINTLQFNFDNNASAPASGVAEANDDILIEDGVNGFSDNYLTSKCVNSSQSSCGATDVSGGGASNGAGKTAWQGGYRMYEISHPLNTGDIAHDFSRVAGQQLGFFLTLQQGSGAQGNTQWPGFRSYLKITIQ